MRIFYLFILFFSFVYGIEVDKGIGKQELLSSSSYYVDYNRTATIDTIATKKFIPINNKELGFGYSPDFTVWIKFVLSNNSDKEISKIIEYSNPLTSFVEFYDAKSKKLLKSSGMLNKDSNESLTPFIKVTLKPHESRTFYIKIASNVTSLIARLNLWDPKEYAVYQKRNEIILALFFGAMGIVILYNLSLFFITRKPGFLYYVLAFLGVFIYYLLYKGVAPLLLPQSWITFVNTYIPFIVLFPVIFLSLFTKRLLSIQENRRLNRVFNYLIAIAILSTILFFFFELHALRNLLYVIIFALLFIVTTFYYNRSSYAKYLFFSWIIFFLTALFMYLENIEIFNINNYFPYYSEVALLLEAISFSLILAHYIEKLDRSKREYEKEIEYKELLISEIEHRIFGLLQSIKFLVLQEEKRKDINLESLHKSITAISEIVRFLDKTESFPKVHMQEYFGSLVKKFQDIYKQSHVTILLNIDTAIELKPKIARSCAKILHEALINIYKYAFDGEDGKVSVELQKKRDFYIFTIADNGKGIEKIREGARGLLLIEEIVNYELNGTIEIDSFDGVKITIRWQVNG